MTWLAVAILLASPSTQPASAAAEDPSPLAQQFMYFPPQLFTDAREVRGRDCTLWTNAVEIDENQLRKQVDSVCEYLAARGIQISHTETAATHTSQPATQPTGRPIVAALYQTQDQYKALWNRVGVYYKGNVFGAGPAGGYSYRVFCATYVEPNAASTIPAELAHELAHVWLWQRAQIANDGNWLTEAVASAVQYRFCPQSANRQEWAQLAARGKYIPLRRLLDTQPMRPDNYWQIGALGELLLDHYGQRLDKVAQAQREGRTPTRIITETLGTDWLTLEREWLEYVKSAQGPLNKP